MGQSIKVNAATFTAPITAALNVPTLGKKAKAAAARALVAVAVAPMLHPLPLLLLSQHQWAVAHLGCLSDTVDITLRELVCGITLQLIWEHSNSTATLRTVSMSLRKSAGTLLERVSVTIKLLEHATRSILTYY